MEKEVLKNKDYDLISVLYHASQAAETCKQYEQDAQSEGDSETAQFFSQVREENNKLVKKGKELLQKRLQ
jgi:hypothetical protein